MADKNVINSPEKSKEDLDNDMNSEPNYVIETIEYNYPYEIIQKYNTHGKDAYPLVDKETTGSKAFPLTTTSEGDNHIKRERSMEPDVKKGNATENPKTDATQDTNTKKQPRKENNELASHNSEETVDAQREFPDPPPFYDPNLSPTLKTTTNSDLSPKLDAISSSEQDSQYLPNSNSKILSGNITQRSDIPNGITSEHKSNLNSVRQGKDSFQLRSFSERSIRKSNRSTIPKPKSSLREPSYKYQREEFLDNKMLISNSKLDGLLFRLFAKPRKLEGDEEKPLPFLDDEKSDLISMDPVTWNIRPMTAVHKETLNSELEFLEESLEPKQVVRRLFMDGTLTHMDYNQITRTEGQGEKAVVRLLVGTLKRRGEKAFPHFIKALKELDLSRVWERLETTDRSLSESILVDQRETERQLETERRATTRNQMETHVEVDENNEDILKRFLQSRSDNASCNISNSKGAGDFHNQGRFGVSEDGRGLQSSQLEQQLCEINSELKALHENLNLLQSARSSNGPRQSFQANPTPSTPGNAMDAKDPKQQPSTRETIDTLDTQQANVSNTNQPIKKSGTCIIL